MAEVVKKLEKTTYYQEIYVVKEYLDEFQTLILEASYTNLYMLWQPLITKTNDHTSGKSLSGISSGEFTRELDKESLLN